MIVVSRFLVVAFGLLFGTFGKANTTISPEHMGHERACPDPKPTQELRARQVFHERGGRGSSGRVDRPDPSLEKTGNMYLTKDSTLSALDGCGSEDGTPANEGRWGVPARDGFKGFLVNPKYTPSTKGNQAKTGGRLVLSF